MVHQETWHERSHPKVGWPTWSWCQSWPASMCGFLTVPWRIPWRLSREPSNIHRPLKAIKGTLTPHFNTKSPLRIHSHSLVLSKSLVALGKRSLSSSSQVFVVKLVSILVVYLSLVLTLWFNKSIVFIYCVSLCIVLFSFMGRVFLFVDLSILYLVFILL